MVNVIYSEIVPKAIFFALQLLLCNSSVIITFTVYGIRITVWYSIKILYLSDKFRPAGFFKTTGF